MHKIIYNTDTGSILATVSSKQDVNRVLTNYENANFTQSELLPEPIWDYKVNLETGQVEKI